MIDGTDILQERWDQERELRPLSQTETAGPDHTARSTRMTTIKTPEQIADEYLSDSHGIKAHGNTERAPMTWWGVRDQIVAAIKADRVQLYRYVLSFEPDAIRDHFEADDDDPTEGASDADLLAVGQAALQDEAFHAALVDALETVSD